MNSLVTEKDTEAVLERPSFFCPADLPLFARTELRRCRPLRRTAEAGVDVYSVSTDTTTHKAWHKAALKLSQNQHDRRPDCAPTVTSTTCEDVAPGRRATFVADPQVSSVRSKLPLKVSVVTRLDLLRVPAAQYVAAHPCEVCPAKWKEGEATLAPSLDLVGKFKFPASFHAIAALASPAHPGHFSLQ